MTACSLKEEPHTDHNYNAHKVLEVVSCGSSLCSEACSQKREEKGKKRDKASINNNKADFFFNPGEFEVVLHEHYTTHLN